MPAFTIFLDQCDNALQGRLSVLGFRHASASTWIRRVGEELNVVWLQKHSRDNTCCVNLGIHYAFLPRVGSTERIVNDFITQPECEIKLRLTADASHDDQWWPLSERSAADISQLVTTKGLAIFETYKLNGMIRDLEVKDIVSGNVDLFKPLTKVRACLLLARLHEHLGEHVKCTQAATSGLEIAGMAVGLKAEFKEILKRQNGVA